MESLSMLEELSIYTTANEIMAITEYKQSYFNNSKNSVEISITIPLNNKTLLKRFVAKLGDKVVTSKIFEKEVANEKYSDSLASGNTGILGNYDEEKNYSLKIGNLNADEKLEILSEFISLISYDDKSYKFSLSTANYPKLNVKQKQDDNWNISNQQLLTPNFTFSLKTNSSITRLISTTHKLTPQFSDGYKSVDITLAALNKNIKILFRTEDINTPKLYEQYDPLLNNYAYSLKFLLDKRYNKINMSTNEPDLDSSTNYTELFESKQINDSQGVFIFLIDQSGSMSGSSIGIAKESLKLFLKSIPRNSYFDIIGFGSSYVAITPEPKFYDLENLNTFTSKIDILQADLGGTEIYAPLKHIYERTYDASLAKNIFLLTDGRVENANNCTDLILKNNKNFVVHAIGIGNSVDKCFIEKCGKLGKGTHHLVSNLQNLNKQVVQALNSALRPYLNNISLSIDEENLETDTTIQYPSLKKNMMVYQDEIFNYSFISPTKIKNSSILNFTAYDPQMNKQISKEYKVAGILNNIEDGNNLNKAIVGTVLKHTEEMKKEEMVELSLKYQILSRETSLFAESKCSNSNNTELTIARIKSVKVSLHTSNNNFWKMPSVTQHIACSGSPPEMSQVQFLKRKTFPGNINSLYERTCTPNIASTPCNSSFMTSTPYCPNFIANTPYNSSFMPSTPYRANFIANTPYNSSFMTSTPYYGSFMPISPNIQSLSEPTTSIYTPRYSPCSPSYEQLNTKKYNFCGEKKFEYNPLYTPTLPSSKKPLDVPKIPDDNDQEFYKNIINTQNVIDGNWDENIITKSIITKMSEKYSNIQTYIKTITVNYIDNISITILVLIYLDMNFKSKEPEYFLIANKAKKYLKDNGVILEEVIEVVR